MTTPTSTTTNTRLHTAITGLKASGVTVDQYTTSTGHHVEFPGVTVTIDPPHSEHTGYRVHLPDDTTARHIPTLPQLMPLLAAIAYTATATHPVTWDAVHTLAQTAGVDLTTTEGY